MNILHLALRHAAIDAEQNTVQVSRETEVSGEQKVAGRLGRRARFEECQPALALAVMQEPEPSSCSAHHGRHSRFRSWSRPENREKGLLAALWWQWSHRQLRLYGREAEGL